MKASDEPFTKVLAGSKQFLIPVFQRDYSWGEDHCKQLWDDVLHVAAEDSPDSIHFLGSIVYIATGTPGAVFSHWLLIDGQQRVTTLTLLLIALRDHLREESWSGGEDAPTVRKIEANFLKNLAEEGTPREHKLVLRRHDQATLAALLSNLHPPAEGSERILENYHFFREWLKKADPEAVYRGIGRIVVVDVTLNAGRDDPQLIFESMNSTGLELSQSDLIRNFILMRLPEPEQTRLYQTYWSNIEDLFRSSERTFDAFIRDYIALKTEASKQEKADNIYFAFRREFGQRSAEPEGLVSFLEDLLRFARYHAAFSIGVEAPQPLRESLAQLRRLVDVPATLVMRLFDCHDRLHTLSTHEFVEALTLIESYVFRRAILGEQTRSYWQIFAGLASRIDSQKPLESLKVGLAQLRDSYRFPADEQFFEALVRGDVYGKRVCLDLLIRLENYDTKEKANTSGCTIEHVMPQNPKLSSDWQKMLGDDWQGVQQRWLHTLGNLTLSAYNGPYSDKPFTTKRDMEHGYRDTPFRLNAMIRDRAAWAAAEIEHRGRDLASRALRIWPALTVEQALVDAAAKAELQRRGSTQSADLLPMSAETRDLFDAFRAQVCGVDPDIVEVAEQHSVSYHRQAFFLEVIPRKRGLGLLLNLDFGEISDIGLPVADVSKQKFVVHAAYDGEEGKSLVHLASAKDIETIMPWVRRAYEEAAT